MNNDHSHLQLETRNFNRALGFWQALGFQLQETRGPDGRRISQLHSDDVEVISTLEEEGGVRYHLRVKAADKVLKTLTQRRRDVKVTRHLSEPGWKKGWVRVEDPDGNVYAVEAA